MKASSSKTQKIPDARHLSPRRRRFRESGHGASDGLAPPADRCRFRNNRGRGFDCGRRLCREPRLHPAHHRAGERSDRQVPDRDHNVRPRDRASGALWHGAIANGARSCALRIRGGRRMDHSHFHGLCGRCNALRAAPANSRPLSFRADFRAAVWTGGGRRAGRPLRLAQCVFRAGGAVRAGHGRIALRASDQSANTQSSPNRYSRRRLRRGLHCRVLECMGAIHHSVCVHRGCRRMGGICICWCRYCICASA